MFFLLRVVFWLGLVLVLLPRDKTPESDKLPQIGASEAAATVIGQRAQDGARKLYQIITDKKAEKEKKAPDHTGSIGDAEAALAEVTPRDTLTQDDLAAAWRIAPAPKAE